MSTPLALAAVAALAAAAEFAKQDSRSTRLHGSSNKNAPLLPRVGCGRYRITVEVAPVGERDTITRVFGRKDPVYTIRTSDGQEALVRGWDLGNHAEVYEALWNDRGRELRGEALRDELSRFAVWLESQQWPMEVFRGTRTEEPMGDLRDVSEQQGPHWGTHWTPMYGVAHRFATGQHDAARKSRGQHGQLYAARLEDLDIVDWPATVYYFYRYTDTKRPVGWSNLFDPEHEVKIKGYRHLPVVVLQQTV